MKNLNITDVVVDDLPGILSLARNVSELTVFPTLSAAGQQTLVASQENEIHNLIDKKQYQARKVNIDNTLAGYIALRDGQYITQLYVDPGYQGKGIGTFLIDDMVKSAREPYLKVRASLNAVGFYTKYGFIQVGEQAEINAINFVPMEYEIKN